MHTIKSTKKKSGDKATFNAPAENRHRYRTFFSLRILQHIYMFQVQLVRFEFDRFPIVFASIHLCNTRYVGFCTVVSDLLAPIRIVSYGSVALLFVLHILPRRRTLILICMFFGAFLRIFARLCIVVFAHFPVLFLPASIHIVLFS